MKIHNFELIQTTMYPDFDLKITLKPSFRCNQSCWFCEEYDNTSYQWTEEDCDLIIEKLSQIPLDKESIYIYFYGGEPTLSEHWEDLHYRIIEIFKYRELFIQTQTNMSVDKDRLNLFLSCVNERKQPNHTIDICSSYHLNKQTPEEFKEKMDICNKHNALGLCFFNSDLLHKDQFMSEFYYLAGHYKDKMKLRFTEIGKGVQDTKEAKQYDDNYALKSYEYNHLMEFHPELREYFEEGFNFNVNIEGNDSIMNFAEVSANDIHKNFRLMKCDCGIKNIVIDHNLKVYHCNDDFKNGINIYDINDINLDTFFDKEVYCMNKACYDGLEFHKWKR